VLAKRIYDLTGQSDLPPSIERATAALDMRSFGIEVDDAMAIAEQVDV
jgi:hypothetical protein